jgi:hypothetical protein
LNKNSANSNSARELKGDQSDVDLEGGGGGGASLGRKSPSSSHGHALRDFRKFLNQT